MTFADPVSTVFKKYGTFVDVLDAAARTPVFQMLVFLALLLPALAVRPNNYGDSPKYPGPQGPYGTPWQTPRPYGVPPGYGPVRY